MLGTMSVNLFLVQISHFQGSKRWNEIDERRSADKEETNPVLDQEAFHTYPVHTEQAKS